MICLIPPLKPGFLYERSVEIDERVVPAWEAMFDKDQTRADDGSALIETSSGIRIRQLKSISQSGAAEPPQGPESS